jgi:hypothetical protein
MEKGSLQSGNTFSKILAGGLGDLLLHSFFFQSARELGMKAFGRMGEPEEF